MPVHADTRQHPLNEGELVGFRSDGLPLQLALGEEARDRARTLTGCLFCSWSLESPAGGAREASPRVVTTGQAR